MPRSHSQETAQQGLWWGNWLREGKFPGQTHTASWQNWDLNPGPRIQSAALSCYPPNRKPEHQLKLASQPSLPPLIPLSCSIFFYFHGVTF